MLTVGPRRARDLSVTLIIAAAIVGIVLMVD